MYAELAVNAYLLHNFISIDSHRITILYWNLPGCSIQDLSQVHVVLSPYPHLSNMFLKLWMFLASSPLPLSHSNCPLHLKSWNSSQLLTIEYLGICTCDPFLLSSPVVRPYLATFFSTLLFCIALNTIKFSLAFLSSSIGKNQYITYIIILSDLIT